MRKISVLISMFMLVTMIQSVKAESYWEWYKRDPEGFYEKMMCLDEESRANGCYSDAVNDNKQSEIIANNNSGSQADKGYVFGQDELHVTGVPEDKRGYSAAGNYTNMPSAGKGWVYGADELHVVGLPTDPETGYTLPGFYGNID